MSNTLPNIRAIFICNKEGKAVTVLTPNHIGRTVTELLDHAHKAASEIGGYVEVSENIGATRYRHETPTKTLILWYDREVKDTLLEVQVFDTEKEARQHLSLKKHDQTLYPKIVNNIPVSFPNS
jgi:hypothetical protein